MPPDGWLKLDAFFMVLSVCFLVIADPKHRNASAIIASFFVISHVSFLFVLNDLRSEYGWLIYQIYNVINCVCIYLLKINKSPLIFIFLLSINVLYNIHTAFFYADIHNYKIIDILYPYICGLLAALCLISQWMISIYGVRAINRADHSNRFLRTFFWFRYGNSNGYLS